MMQPGVTVLTSYGPKFGMHMGGFEGFACADLVPSKLTTFIRVVAFRFEGHPGRRRVDRR